MDHLVRKLGVAVGAKSWLSDAATVNFHHHTVVTHMALEESFTHLRDQGGGADNHAIDGDQLIDVWKY